MAENLIKERRAEVERQSWALRQRGYTQEHIAQELGVDQATISRTLARIENRLAKEFIARAARVKAAQTVQLETITDEAFRAWERSQSDAEMDKTVTKDTAVDVDVPGGKSVVPATETTTTQERRGQAGDPRFLAEARNAMADVRAIWGLDAPKRQDLTSGGEPLSALLLDSAVIHREGPHHDGSNDSEASAQDAGEADGDAAPAV